MFISFEGLDFCGKSTQVELLKNYLIGRGEKVEIYREPGGTEISEKIRVLLLDKKNYNMTTATELLLFAASRAQLVREVFIPKLKQGIFIISDRFHDSSIAYQGFGRGLNLEFIKALQNYVIAESVPDITFYIDLTLEDIAKRKMKLNKNEFDRIEVSNNEFYQKVRDGYLELSESLDRFITIDGSKPIQEIHALIVKEIENYLLKENTK